MEAGGEEGASGCAQQHPPNAAVNQPDICVIEALLPLCGVNYICFLMTQASPGPPELIKDEDALAGRF